MPLSMVITLGKPATYLKAHDAPEASGLSA